MSALQIEVALVDGLIVLTMLSTCRLLLRLLGNSPYRWMAFALPTLALAWGLMWMFWPPFTETRLLPPPRGQGAGILALILLLISPLLLAEFRRRLHEVDWRPLAAFSYWRAVYGAILIVLGLQGALPDAFYWSAGIGDMLAGFWGVSLFRRNAADATPEFKVWNLFALADLLHVIVLGALFLRPFFVANSGVSPITLLPLTGVPVMIALHVWAGAGLWRRTCNAYAR